LYSTTVMVNKDEYIFGIKV